MEQLSGRVAVVTGGASGIGRALAERCAAAGMQVVVADVEQGALDATAAELGVTGVLTDVADEASVGALAAEVIDRFGAVHLLCNNAGVGGGGAIANQTLNDWRWVIDVNLWGVIHGLHHFLPHLLANPDGGHVVNTASMAGLAVWPGIGPYSASKYAVVAISETLAVELEGTAVGVSVLCPGVVATNIFSSHRNRPTSLRNDAPKPEARKFNADLARQVGSSPLDVADTVLAGVKAGDFWILTHPELLDAVQERHDRLMAAGDCNGPS